MSALDAATGKTIWETPTTRVVHDEQGRCASRAGTEIDAGLRGWKAVRDRHDRCDLRLRCKDGKGALAKAGLGARADVHDARVLADCRSRAGDLSPGRPRQGRHHGVRRQHRRDEVELGWRWTRLRLADRRGSRRHAAAHRADAGEARRPRRRDRRAVVGAALRQRQFHELGHADSGRSDRDRVERRTDDRSDRREARRQVDDRRRLDERRSTLSPQQSGPDRRYLVRAVHAQQRTVLRRRRENRQERVDVRTASGWPGGRGESRPDRLQPRR